MKDGRASTTAVLVAFLRACANAGLTRVPDFSDPTAEQLLPEFWRSQVRRLQEAAQAGKRPFGMTFARGAADFMALRTRMIDQAVQKALGHGPRQLVILGAGLDGRAHRLPGLRAVKVFEVDHPASQAFKRARTERMATACAELHYVSVDFEKQGLEEPLRAAGHHAAEPTVWIWEGVVMYLTDAAVRATLGAISRLSAAGSTLVLNYHSPRPWGGLTNVIFGAFGERQTPGRTPEWMAQELRSAGFEPQEDLGIQDWGRRLNGPILKAMPVQHMRLVVARR